MVGVSGRLGMGASNSYFDIGSIAARKADALIPGIIDRAERQAFSRALSYLRCSPVHKEVHKNLQSRLLIDRRWPSSQRPNSST